MSYEIIYDNKSFFLADMVLMDLVQDKGENLYWRYSYLLSNNLYDMKLYSGELPVCSHHPDELIRMMAADGKFPTIELHVIEIIAKKIGITPIQILSFVLDEIHENHISKEEGLVIIDNFVRHLIITGA